MFTGPILGAVEDGDWDRLACVSGSREGRCATSGSEGVADARCRGVINAVGSGGLSAVA